MHSFPHSDEYQHLLAELRAARDASGITQVELATKLGVHQTLVSKVERGVRRADMIELRAWLLVLGVSLRDFVDLLEARLERNRRPMPPG